MIIDDQEQPGPRRAFPLRVRHPGPDEDVGDPPLVRPGRLIPAVRLRLGRPGPPPPPPGAPPARLGPRCGNPPTPVGLHSRDIRRRTSRATPTPTSALPRPKPR